MFYVCVLFYQLLVILDVTLFCFLLPSLTAHLYVFYVLYFICYVDNTINFPNCFLTNVYAIVFSFR